MMAKKAAEKAKKDFEERMAKEAESRRLSQIPQWKRDLLARREETENKLKWVEGGESSIIESIILLAEF